MKESIYDDLFEEKEEKTDLQATFFKYIIRWPWFVASIIICLLGAWLYLRYTTPVYNISATIIIKDEKKGGKGSSSMTAFEDLGILSSSQNIDNEIEILRSKSLAKDVVNELGLYINYFAKGNFNDIELYNTSPVRVQFSPEDADQLPEPILMTLTVQPGGKLLVKATINEQPIVKQFDKLPAILPSEAGTISFLAGRDSAKVAEPVVIDVTIQRPFNVGRGYTNALSIEPTSKTTSVAVISLKNTIRRRGEDFINKLVEMYNRDANNDKNEIAQNTAKFIDERIAVINKELGTTEQELASFKRDAGLTDVSSDAQQAMSEKSLYEKLRVENGTQLNLVQYLADYINNPENKYAALPVNIGLQNTAVTDIISQYNEMIMERSRLLRSSSETNPVVKRLDNSIGDMRANLAITIASARKGLLISKADLEQQAGKYAGRISNAPTQELQFVGMQRQQEIKAGLYLMLLQKREENNITLAATANNAKIIDDAFADTTPVSPKSLIIYLAALVLGIVLPVGAIYLVGLTQFRIEGRSDVEKLTDVSIVGDVPMAAQSKSDANRIAVHENTNDIMTETFRGIRTNLLFMLGEAERKVILVTSTISGEGKTFIASNLAVSLALLGKRVLIVGLDIRKPGLNKVFRISAKDRGITQYLASPQSTNLMSLIQPSGVTANLYLLPGGSIPPNPTELLARQALDDAFELLRNEFDYIVLDTAPIGMVTDTQLIARVADISVYVCRADYTHKKDYLLINDLQEQKRLPSLCTVINGLDMSKRKYGYYYGYGKYGKYYGYGKKYSYGYGYGSDQQTKN